ncbi:MAG: hypothetical protein ACK58L_03105 [Planctomycetota bacterium]
MFKAAITRSVIAFAAIGLSIPPCAQDAVPQPDLVVPYSADQPALRADQVFIRHDDFLKLYQQANPDVLKGPSTSPLGSAVVGSWLRSGSMTQVDGAKHVMSFDGRFAVWCDSEKPVSVSLPIGPVAIRSVKVDSKDAVVQPLVVGEIAAELQNFNAQQLQQLRQTPAPVQNNPAYAVQIAGRGFHVVDLRFDISAQIEGELGRADLPLRSPAAGTLEWTLPVENLDAKIHGRTNVYRREGNVVIVPIAQLSTIRLQWLPKVQKAAGDVVLHSSTASAMALQDSGMTLRTTASVTVRQGEISELDVTIPDGYTVQSVTGDDIAGWEVQNTDNSRSLRLQLRRAVNDATKITMQLYRAAPTLEQMASLPVPIPVVKGASRDLGSVILRTGSQFQVRSDTLSAVTQVNPAEATNPDGDELPGRPMLAWRYTRHPASIAIKVAPTADEVINDALHAVRLEEQRQLWSSRMTLRIAGSPRSRVDIAVPKNFLAIDVNATSLKDWYFSDDIANAVAGTKTLSVQFTDARSGTVQIAIQGQIDRDADHNRLTLRPPAVLNATRSTSQLAVWLDAASESAGFESGVGNGSDWAVRPPASMQAACAEISTTPPSLAFASSVNQPGSLAIRLRDAISTLIGETVTVTHITETAIEITMALNWTVNRAAADTFAIELPTSLASIMNFEVPGQRRITRSDLGNGKMRIELQTQTPVTDRLFVIGTASLPLPTNKVVRADVPNILIPDGAPSTLSGQQHFWVVVNQSNGLLQPTADQPENKVAADQITTQIPQPLLQQAVAVVRLKPETAAWNLVYPEQHQVAPAVVTLATHTTVIADDGSWRSRHQMQVINESRQFLPVVFPPDSRLLFCLVQGRPSRVVVRQDGNLERHLIPIPQSGALATGFDVEFALAGRFDHSAAAIRRDWISRRLSIPVPTFPEFRDDPDYGISVSRNRWSIYVPDSWRAIPAEDPATTNVVKAGAEELEDASLLSDVEQATSLFNAAKTAKTEYARRKLASEVQQQVDRLNRSAGKSQDAEQQRGALIGKLNDLQMEFGAQEQAQPIQIQQDGNGYLYENEAEQNFNNSFNVDRFWADNGLASGGRFNLPQSQSGYGGEDKSGSVDLGFRFGISIEDKMETLEKSREREETGKESDKKMQTEPVAEPELERLESKSKRDMKDGERASGMVAGGRGRSSLLQRRGSNQAEPVPPADATRLGIAVDNLDRVPTADEPVIGQPEAMQQSTAQTQASPPESGRVLASTGLLSLKFEIPSDGNRFDFIRVGGNPSLALDVRSSEAFQKALGLIWLAACSLVGLLLIGPGRRGDSPEFLLRLFLIAAIAGLLALLMMPNDSAGIGLAIFVVSAIAVATVLTVRNLRRSYEA